ncbi:putative lysophospholipase [Labeo rohita]|uniref:Lysophospholipase n=1 Tax=Labeo rohita TaxID=84645 RepID=A0ABQ8LGR8_LABRO|nr:putative lysophospholipase [Labeo rohita]
MQRKALPTAPPLRVNGELKLELGLMDLIPPSSELSIDPEPSVCPDLPFAHPQPTICAVDSLRICHSPSASWLEDPSFPPPASESWTLPHSSDPAAPPRLLCSLVSTVAHQPTSSTGLPHPSGSALVGRCPAIASGLRLCLGAPSHWLRWAPPFLQLRLSNLSLGLISLALRILGDALSCRLSVSTSTFSAAVGRPPGVVSPSFTIAPPPGSLGLAWLLLLRVPSVSFLRLIHPGPFCLLLGSSLHCHHPGLCLLSTSRESVLCQSLLLH